MAQAPSDRTKAPEGSKHMARLHGVVSPSSGNVFTRESASDATWRQCICLDPRQDMGNTLRCRCLALDSRIVYPSEPFPAGYTAEHTEPKNFLNRSLAFSDLKFARSLTVPHTLQTKHPHDRSLLGLNQKRFIHSHFPEDANHQMLENLYYHGSVSHVT